MMGLSLSHLIILGIIILIFGSRKLPELGAGLGQGLRAFKSGLEGKEVQISQDSEKEKERLADASPQRETEDAPKNV